MIDALVGDGALDRHEFAQRNQRRRAGHGTGLGQCIGIAGAHAQRQQFLRTGAAGQRQLQHDVHVLLLARHVQQIHRFTAHRDGKCLGNRLGADAVQRGLFLVNHEPHLRLVGFDIPIRVHDAGRVVENVDDFVRQRVAAFLVRPINFGDQRLQHRRAGRHFGDGDARAEFRRNLRHARTDAFGDVVALRLAFAFGHEIDLDVGHVRAAPHEVMAHQAVEIERRRHARVNLIIRHFRFGAHGGGNFARGLRGAFERAAFRHVENDLELALVVERQHFHLHPADADQRHRAKQQADDAREKNPTPLRRVQSAAS